MLNTSLNDMVYFFIWFLFSIAVGMYAGSRGRGSGNWFVISILLSPLLGFIFCAVSPNLKQEADLQAIKDALPSEKSHVKCSHCAEFVLPEASVCKHCGGSITPQPAFRDLQAETLKQMEEKDQAKMFFGWIAVAVVILVAYIATH